MYGLLQTSMHNTLDDYQWKYLLGSSEVRNMDIEKVKNLFAQSIQIITGKEIAVDTPEQMIKAVQENYKAFKDVRGFDLILMDDLMPNMSGTETLDVLRKIERVSGYYIPVVVLTANATTGMKEKYLENGFDDYLAKPIDREELDKVLKKYLKK